MLKLPLLTKPDHMSPAQLGVMIHEYEVASLTGLMEYAEVDEKVAAPGGSDSPQGVVFPVIAPGVAGALVHGQKITCQQLQLDKYC